MTSGGCTDEGQRSPGKRDDMSGNPNSSSARRMHSRRCQLSTSWEDRARDVTLHTEMRKARAMEEANRLERRRIEALEKANE